MVELGNDCKPGSALSLLFWLAEQRELSDSAIPLALADYVAMRLCGAEPVTEYTSALGTLNVQTNLWYQEAFDMLGGRSVELASAIRSVSGSGKTGDAWQ